MFDMLSITVNIGVLGYLIFSIFTGGLQSFNDNYIFIGYLTFTIFTLPNLLSKVLFKSRPYGITSAILFLYFPIQFLLQVLIANFAGLSLSEVLPFGVIFNMILWNILFTFFLLEDNKSGNQSEKLLKEISRALVPAILYVLFVFIFIRQQNSVVALDYLQHLTVPNKMFEEGILCFLPGQCSNLFLQHGYTTFYHIVFGNILSFLGNDPVKTFYVLDVIFPLVVSIPVYMIFKRTTKSTLWAQLGTLLALLTFVMGGYDFVFFIPQTFALYLFILAFKERRINLVQLILISILLISTHFIIGTILAGYLWFRYLIIERLEGNKEKNIFLLLLLLSVMFFILANIAGFSIEKLWQEEAVDAIGSLTNPYYPNNLPVFIQNLGAGWLLILIAYISELSEKRKSDQMLTLLSLVSFGTIFYLLAPTYANKFAIGLGLFGSLTAIQYLWRLGFKPIIKLFVFLSLISLWSFNFYVQYNKYLGFYTQEDGTASAIVEEDLAIIEYIEKEKLGHEYIISDPYTQLIVTSFTGVDTANAQYMSLETRNNLLQYLEDPNAETYEELLTSPGIPAGKDFYILYTSRLAKSLEFDDTSWIYNIYSLNIDNSHPITNISEELIEDQKRLGHNIVYISNNFILFK